VEVETMKRLIEFPFKAGYMFSWDEIPGNDSRALIEFLTQNFGIDWVKMARIEKIDDGKVISVSTEKNSLSLRLNDEKTKLKLETEDGRTSEFITMTENGKLNIYKDVIWVEVDEPEVEGGLKRAGIQPGEMPEKAKQNFETAFGKIRPIAESVIATLYDIPKRPEIEVEFGLKFNAGAGILIASAGSEANFQVKLTWKQKERENK
jgi:hypothetical protein